MSERRLERLEDKVDRLDEKVDKVSTDIVEIKTDMGHHMDMVKEHVAGDGKIITKLEPILDDLGSMVIDHQFRKKRREDREARVKYWSARLGLAATAVGLLLGLVKLGIL